MLDPSVQSKLRKGLVDKLASPVRNNFFDSYILRVLGHGNELLELLKRIGLIFEKTGHFERGKLVNTCEKVAKTRDRGGINRPDKIQVNAMEGKQCWRKVT